MDNAVAGLHARAAILQQQIALAMALQRDKRLDTSGLIATYQSALATLYGGDLPLASLGDTSDVIFRAEGPSARHHAAVSSVVGWLCEEAERRLRQLSVAALHLVDSAGEAAARDIRILMNGIAPGSLYIGFSVDSASRAAGEAAGVTDLASTSMDEVLTRARSAIGNLVLVPRFIGSDSVNEGIADAIADPQLRDATLMAAYHLSPTGKRGIHTIEISAPRGGEPAASFTNRERVVLRETAVRQPLLRKTRKGAFFGELREIDLDARRFQLRHVPEVGTLRCILDGLTAELGRKHIGKGVKVTGVYEEDAQGRPGLMRVDKIAPIQRQKRLTM